MNKNPNTKDFEITLELGLIIINNKSKWSKCKTLFTTLQSALISLYRNQKIHPLLISLILNFNHTFMSKNSLRYVCPSWLFFKL